MSRRAMANRARRGYIRVAIPLAGFNLSGGVKSLLGVANALADRGHAVRILAPDFAAEPPLALHSGVRVAVLASGPHWLPLPLRKLIHLARLTVSATARCDICLANYFTTAYVAWVSRSLRGDGAVLVYNVRGYEPDSHGLLANASLPSRLARWALARLSYRLPLRKIVTTRWLRERVGDPNAVVVGHGIDLTIFRPGVRRPAAETLVVGTIGRSGEAKGYPDFLRAVDALDPILPITVLVAAPDPVVMPIRFPSERLRPTTEEAMAEFYRACDLFVFASRGEGFGLPPLEAMACGRAVVTTDCGGVREFARPNENCLMTQPADPPALAKAIERLVRDPCERERLVETGTLTARAWDRGAVHARFCDFLEELARDDR